MNKSIKILLALVVLAAAAYFIFFNKPWSTIKGELKDFSIADTGKITKFFLADKRGEQVLIEKNAQGVWIVNGKFPADPSKVNLLLSTMKQVTVRNPVSEKDFNQVVAMLASDGIKAEFYEGDDLEKTIYVGPVTPDQGGTYMVIEGSSKPFVTHIPGFVGYLTPRFITTEIKWREKLVFNYKADDVKEVSVQYPEQPAASFDIQNGNPAVVTATATKQTIPADPNFTKYYVSGFNNLYFEAYDEAFSKTQQDSVRSTKPFCVITVTGKSGKQTKLTLHYKKVDKRTKERFDEKGNFYTFDTERYFAFVNNDPEMVYVQEYNFGRLFKKAADFAASAKAQ